MGSIPISAVCAVSYGGASSSENHTMIYSNHTKKPRNRSCSNREYIRNHTRKHCTPMSGLQLVGLTLACLNQLGVSCHKCVSAGSTKFSINQAFLWTTDFEFNKAAYKMALFSLKLSWSRRPKNINNFSTFLTCQYRPKLRCYRGRNKIVVRYDS